MWNITKVALASIILIGGIIGIVEQNLIEQQTAASRAEALRHPKSEFLRDLFSRADQRNKGPGFSP